jgi:hypothetical protein
MIERQLDHIDGVYLRLQQGIILLRSKNFNGVKKINHNCITPLRDGKDNIVISLII